MNPTAITLGNFDGVHKGHRALFDKTMEIAQDQSLPSLAITYHPNPAVVLGKKPDFSYLQSLDDRKKSILDLGINSVEVLEFNENLANKEAEEFLEEILMGRFHARHIVIGYNHCFGKGRRGNFRLLEELAPKYGYNVYQVEPVYSQGEKISSSLIRKFLTEGNLIAAKDCLGRNFSIQGKVIHGKKIGSQIGSPTANVKIPDNQVLPAHGVYATRTNGMDSVTNIGTKPTFNDESVSLETHILDWNGNLYEENIHVEFVEKLRNISKFINPSELSSQIQKDIERARLVLKRGA